MKPLINVYFKIIILQIVEREQIVSPEQKIFPTLHSLKIVTFITKLIKIFPLLIITQIAHVNRREDKTTFMLPETIMQTSPLSFSVTFIPGCSKCRK